MVVFLNQIGLKWAACLKFSFFPIHGRASHALTQIPLVKSDADLKAFLSQYVDRSRSSSK